MHLAVPVSQGPIQHIGTYLQEKVGALRARAHMLLLAHAAVDEVVHDRIDVRRGYAPARSADPREVWHRPPISADIPRKVADHGFNSLASEAAVIPTRAQPTDRLAL